MSAIITLYVKVFIGIIVGASIGLYLRRLVDIWLQR